MQSCLYEGRVEHRRSAPVRHAFRYRVAMLYLDLGELASLPGRPLLGVERAAPLGFRRRDHLGDPEVPLDESVRALVASRTGRRPEGPIRLLTLPRWAGYAFNPVSFHFCFDAPGTGIEAVVADVTNTPWKERHAYVLPVPPERRADAVLRFDTPKEFHVSPFMAMDLRYAWRFTQPGRRLAVQIANRDASGRFFDASLSLARRELAWPRSPARSCASRSPPPRSCHDPQRAVPRRPLRSRERLLRPVPRSDDDLLRRHLRARGRDAGAGVDREVRAPLPQARAASGGSRAGDRLRLGRIRPPCGGAPRATDVT